MHYCVMITTTSKPLTLEVYTWAFLSNVTLLQAFVAQTTPLYNLPLFLMRKSFKSVTLPDVMITKNS